MLGCGVGECPAEEPKREFAKAGLGAGLPATPPLRGWLGHLPRWGRSGNAWGNLGVVPGRESRLERLYGARLPVDWPYCAEYGIRMVMYSPAIILGITVGCIVFQSPQIVAWTIGGYVALIILRHI